MIKRLLYAAVIIVTVLSSACSKLVAVHCTPSGKTGWFINFVGFDSGEISNVQVIRFAKGEGLKTPIDTLNYEVLPNAFRKGDTLFPSMGLGQGNDYKVMVTPAFREWHVTDIQFQDAVQHDRPSSAYAFDCPMDSYVVDSQKVHASGFWLVR